MARRPTTHDTRQRSLSGRSARPGAAGSIPTTAGSAAPGTSAAAAAGVDVEPVTARQLAILTAYRVLGDKATLPAVARHAGCSPATVLMDMMELEGRQVVRVARRNARPNVVLQLAPVAVSYE